MQQIADPHSDADQPVSKPLQLWFLIDSFHPALVFLQRVSLKILGYMLCLVYLSKNESFWISMYIFNV